MSQLWIGGLNLSGLFFILLYHIFFGFLLVVFLFLAADSLLVLWYAEVITSAEFHPTHCNTLAYSSSKGSIRLVDLRQSALCDTHSQMWAFIWYFLLPISNIPYLKNIRWILMCIIYPRYLFLIFLWLFLYSCSFEQHEAPGSRSFFTEIIASISDIKFSKDGRHILSRDYMTLKVCTCNFSCFKYMWLAADLVKHSDMYH